MLPLDEDDVLSILGESTNNQASGALPSAQSTVGDAADLPPLPNASFGNPAFPTYTRHQMQHQPAPQPAAHGGWESGVIDGDAIKSMQAVQAAQQNVAARARAMNCRVEGGTGSAGMGACGGSGGGGAVLTKQGWTPEEDETIVRMVQLTGQKWSFIACALPGRTDDAVRNRYLRLQKKMAAAACSNKPAVTSEDLAEVQATKKGDMWTVEEDARIIEGVQHHGFKWQQIAAMLPGRSANAVRNRYLRCSPQGTQLGGGGTNGPLASSSHASSVGRAAGAELHKDRASRIAPEQTVAQPMSSTGDELVSTDMAGGSAQGSLGHLFWDPAALYGEALESIRDDLFSHDGLRDRTPSM